MKNKKIIEAIKYWGQVFLIPIYWLSFLVPRNKKIWVFGSSFGKRFADNPRYFYLYISQLKKTDIKAVWISHNKSLVKELRNKGYVAYCNKSFGGVWYCLRSYIFIFDNYSKDISFWLSGGAKKINTWHGIPLKKIQMDNLFDRIRHPSTRWQKFKWLLRRLSDEKPYHYIVTTSNQLNNIYRSAFRTNNVLCCGYPRNDIFFSNKATFYMNNELEYLKYLKDLKSKNKMQIIFYMPTFRDSETKFFEVIDQIKFNTFLINQNYMFIIKLHPKSKLYTDFKKINCSNICIMPSDLDPYFYINEIDILVTDYSSIYFDFLLTDKPIIFFNYDLQEYLKDTREMYFEYDEFTPGYKVKNMDELIDKLIRIKQHNTNVLMLSKRIKIRDIVFNNIDGKSSERLYKQIKKIFNI